MTATVDVDLQPFSLEAVAGLTQPFNALTGTRTADAFPSRPGTAAHRRMPGNGEGGIRTLERG